MKIKITKNGFDFSKVSNEEIIDAYKSNEKFLKELPERADVFQEEVKEKLLNEKKIINNELNKRKIKNE